MTTREHLQGIVRLYRIIVECRDCSPRIPGTPAISAFASTSMIDHHMDMLQKRFEAAERHLLELERAPS